MENKYNILPDWTEPKELVLVDPTELKSRTKGKSRIPLFRFYKQFINLIKDTYKGELKITICTPMLGRSGYPVSFFHQITNRDIWIRDWAPINAQNIKGDNILVKAKYEPSYCLGNTYIDEEAGRILQLKYQNELKTIPIKWDGGNITTNGKILICTDRIFKENSQYSRYDIENQIRARFNMKQLIIIPTEKLDVVGHVDGVVRFIDEKTLMIVSYPEYYTEECRYVEKVVSALSRQMPNDTEYIYIPSELSNYVNKENIYSAHGSYLNYLRLGNQIYIPQYGIYADKEAIRVLNKRLFQKYIEIIPVTLDGINELADLGGVLNCITWLKF